MRALSEFDTSANFGRRPSFQWFAVGINFMDLLDIQFADPRLYFGMSSTTT